jgi:CRP-like cAMP-binding protein
MKTLSVEEIEASHTVLKAIIERAGPLYETTWQFIKTHGKPTFYKKKATMIQEGELPQVTGFIIQGAAKSYYTSPIDGRQIVTRLYVPNDFCGPVSFHLGQPSVENIEFVSDSWLICTDYPDIMTLYNSFPDYNRIYTTFLEYYTRMQEEKVRDLQMLTVGQRLEKLMATAPHYFNYFTIADIASYLGTERETLTRLRNKHYKSKD